MNQEENLDDVISSLLDDFVDDESTTEDVQELTGEPVTLTERAARQVLKIKADNKDHENLYLRVAVEGGGCSGLSYKLGLDHRTEEDTIFENFGVELIVDEKHLMYLEGIQIDYPDGLDARGFTFDNPNAADNCGCGTSFFDLNHIRANLRFVIPEEGGRSFPIRTGYRCQFNCDNTNNDWDTAIELIDNDYLKPGEFGEAYFQFKLPEVHKSKIKVGLKFVLKEGPHCVARGEVLELIDL